MGFLESIAGIIAKALISKIEARLEAFFKKLENFNEMASKKDKEALELKEMIKVAQTDEERDVLLDKMDGLLRSTIKFK